MPKQRYNNFQRVLNSDASEIHLPVTTFLSLKQVIWYFISKAKCLNGLLARQRFGLIAQEEPFKTSVAIHN